MKTYKISIGTFTSRGNFTEVSQTFVNSVKDYKVIESVYSQKYSPMSIKVEEIKEVEILGDEESGFKISSPINYGYSNTYTVYIQPSRINNYKESTSDLFALRNSVKEEESNVLNKICEQFNFDKDKINSYDIKDGLVTLQVKDTSHLFKLD